MGNMTLEEEAFSNLLELAANDDLDSFKTLIGSDPTAADQPRLWYARVAPNKMSLVHRTPLMVAATYGSNSILSFLLSLSSVDVNTTCRDEKTTALHCAASGGSHTAVESVRLLLAAGADPNLTDSQNRRASDVITVPTLFSDAKTTLQELLGSPPDLTISVSPPLSSSPPSDNSNSPNSLSSPMAATPKKEYPVDPTLPDIKSSIYASDEFRMYSFKVRPCSRAYSHDWTECPFVHPGENARRRDPRKFHYSCVPCPDFRRGGACRRSDMCEYAHGVFESWLHPAQYRTRLCKDGVACDRRVCFFAHTAEELRPLYVSTGSAVPAGVSPRSSAASLFLSPPGSPSSWANNNNNNNGGNNNNGFGGNNFSRLRASLSARDMPVDELSLILDMEKMNDLCLNSNNNNNNNNIRVNKQLGQANLDELFASEMSLSSLSPRFNNNNNNNNINNNLDQVNNFFSPVHKSAVLNHRLLSPINTNNLSVSTGFVPAGMSPPGRNMSARTIEALASPLSSRLAALAQRERFGTGGNTSLVGNNNGNNNNNNNNNVFSASPWAKMGSPLSKVDWSVNGANNGGDEPDLSWVNSLVSQDIKDNNNNNNNNNNNEGLDQIGAWLENMQLDQIK